MAELLYGPAASPYPGVDCRAVFDCPSCGGVFDQWMAAGAPLEPMPEEIRELRARVRTERDPRLIEAGEPPWGEVLPGTDEVEYFTAKRSIPLYRWLSRRRTTETVLFRTVAKRGAFYIESYAGLGRWVSDSDPMEYLLSDPGQPMQAKEITGREAALVMDKLDAV
jgi:hypothetical protein